MGEVALDHGRQGAGQDARTSARLGRFVGFVCSAVTGTGESAVNLEFDASATHEKAAKLKRL